MRPSSLLLASALLSTFGVAGCTGKGDDTGTGDSGDSNVDTDTGLPPDFTFALSGETEGSTVTLTWLDLSSLGTETPVTGAVRYSAATSGATAGVAFGTVPAEDLQEVDPENAPGLKLAGYIPGLHVDADGDGEVSGDETYAGVGLAWPIYVEGELPSEYADLGLVDGWNALEFIPDSSVPVVHDITAIPLAGNLVERTSITFGGSFDGSDARLAVIPGPTFEGGSVDAYVYDDVLTDPWSVTLDSAPDDDHFSEMEGVGYAALEVPIAYADSNGSGDFTETDAILSAACSASLPVALIYLPGVSDLLTGWSLAAQGVGTGWIGLTIGDTGGGAIIDDAGLQDLALDGSCTLD